MKTKNENEKVQEILEGKKSNETMKINWKLRLKNKTTLIALITLIVGFIYQILSLFEVVPKIGESDTMSVVMLIVNILVGLGVVVDPTTKGLGDSTRALTYINPKGE